MQHQLSTRNPREAALENWWMSIVQLAPRSLMIGGIAILGLAFFSGEVNDKESGPEPFKETSAEMNPGLNASTSG